MVIDLNTSSGTLTIDGEVAATRLTTTASGAGGVGLNQIGAVNLFAHAGGDLGTYCIDDATFTDVTGVGMQEAEAAKALPFPNPTAGAFVIDIRGVGPGAEVRVLDAAGRIIAPARALVRQGSRGHAAIDLANHPEGQYSVRILHQMHERVRHITKQ